MATIEPDRICHFIYSMKWQNLFDGHVLQKAKKLSQSSYIASASSTLLETGDWEICSHVLNPDSHQNESSLFFWGEGDEVKFEGECDCAQGGMCCHNAATLFYLAKAQRATRVFSSKPNNTERVNEAKKSVDFTNALNNKSVALEVVAQLKEKERALFKIRVEKRPVGGEYLWLPETYLRAYVCYGSEHYDLDPSGKSFLQSSAKKSRRQAEEIYALNTLYALDLQPIEFPVKSLKKLLLPKGIGIILTPNKKEWSEPSYYWQRFYFEALPALQKRGWKVEVAAHAITKPLEFKAEGWYAEIVEEGKGWFTLSAGFEVGEENFALQPILATLLECDFLRITENMAEGKEFLIFLPDGRGLSLPIGRFRTLLETLGYLVAFDFTDRKITCRETDAAQLIEQVELTKIAPKKLDDLRKKIHEKHKSTPVSPPSELKATLRDYQLQGFNWMQYLTEFSLGGVLADDMGLGKTLQTITHILKEKELTRSNGLPTLVIAPTSVVMNWQKEIDKFAPTLTTLILQGTQRKAKFDQINTVDIVLTSFALLHRDIEKLECYRFYLTVLDEAQHIKNAHTQVSKAAKRLNTKHRLCLSGTPVENNLGELWSLMSFVMPGLLGSEESFNEHYRNKIEKTKSQSARQSLNKRLDGLILRRTKNTVAKELPPKTEIVHTIVMNSAQKDLYETVRSTMDKKVRKALAAKGQEAQIIFLDALLKLRQICCHPQLLKKSSNHTAESAKFNHLIELLETLRSEGHRVLLFSQFTAMLATIEAYFIEQNISYLKLTGETKNRQQLVDKFQSGIGDVFLISLKAGGTGLTLTGADTVIHYDPWWNPAVENQATDRAYRIGQTKPVMVHKLICQNTVEEKILKMQEKKHTIAEDILSGALDKVVFDEDLLGELLT